jgi:hypothetical protein
LKRISEKRRCATLRERGGFANHYEWSKWRAEHRLLGDNR